MTDKDSDEIAALIAMQHQIRKGEEQTTLVTNLVEESKGKLESNGELLDDMLAKMEAELSSLGISENQIDTEVSAIGDTSETLIEANDLQGLSQGLGLIDTVSDKGDYDDWNSYMVAVKNYASRNSLNLGADPYQSLMSENQLKQFHQLVNDDFKYEAAKCDRYDYGLAAAAGAVGGLIDILFVSTPGSGFAGEVSDKAVNKAVRGFAGMNGWSGPREHSDPTRSAIGFLEKKFKVNYDHRHTGDVNGALSMSAKNHHLKSAAHSPDICGLFFSILNQFTNTASFYEATSGQMVHINTENFELQGSSFAAKIFSGFVNWIGHIISDIAGASGSKTRGAGVPMPLYALLQKISVGQFGSTGNSDVKQNFAEASVKVFEQGYDARHGLALAIPVLVTELLTRLIWVLKQMIHHNKTLRELVVADTSPELRRMLVVSHGSLILLDVVDAAARSGGNLVSFLVRSNMVAWTRFSLLALKEAESIYLSGRVDREKLDDHLDSEYRRMLRMPL